MAKKYAKSRDFLYIGRKYKMDHDVSLLVPELWARLTPEERDPRYLLQRGYLERLVDFEYEGRPIPASRLGSEFMPTLNEGTLLYMPAERIYRAFLDADAMARWIPPYGFTGKVHAMEARLARAHTSRNLGLSRKVRHVVSV